MPCPPTGILVAKCLQDGRLMDMPLSRPFLKLLTQGEVGHSLGDPVHERSHGPSPTHGPPSTPCTMGESWHSDTSDLIASIEEVEKEMKLDGERQKQVT